MLLFTTLDLASITSPITTGCCFCSGSTPSFFLELFLHWSPVAYWAPTDLAVPLSISYLFCLFILFMGFSRQEYWSGLPLDHSGTKLEINNTRKAGDYTWWKPNSTPLNNQEKSKEKSKNTSEQMKIETQFTQTYGESPGRGNLVGCRLWGHTESDTTEATQQQMGFCKSCSKREFYSDKCLY